MANLGYEVLNNYLPRLAVTNQQAVDAMVAAGAHFNIWPAAEQALSKSLVQPAQADAWAATVGANGQELINQLRAKLAVYEPQSTYKSAFEIWQEQYPPVVPAAPTNLTAVATSPNQVDLAWVDNSGNEVGFFIDRSTDGNSAVVGLGSVDANITTFSDTTVAGGTTYYYRVVAVSSTNKSPPSNVATVTTPVS